MKAKSKSQKKRLAIQKKAAGQQVFRSSKTGRFVTQKFAVKHKATTEKETV